MYWYVSIYSEECFWPQYLYPKLIPNNGYCWCPIGKLSHLGLEQLYAKEELEQVGDNELHLNYDERINFLSLLSEFEDMFYGTLW